MVSATGHDFMKLADVERWRKELFAMTTRSEVALWIQRIQKPPKTSFEWFGVDRADGPSVTVEQVVTFKRVPWSEFINWISNPPKCDESD